MSAPPVSAAAEQVYRLLPDYLRAADEGSDWTLRRFVAAAAAGLDDVNTFLTRVDPDTSVSGTCELVNADAVPRAWLPWLGWLVGIDVAAVPVAYARDVVRDISVTQRRGSVLAIAAAVRRTLTGSQDVVVLTKPPDAAFPAWTFDSTHPYASARRYDGGITDPWSIIVVTKTAQTPDTVATLAAAMSEKPAGIKLTLQTMTGSTYAQLTTRFATYDVMRASGRTYNDLATSFA